MAALIRRDQGALLALDLPVRASFCEFDITVFGVNMPAILLRVRVNQPPDFGLGQLPKGFWFGGDLLGNKQWVCLREKTTRHACQNESRKDQKKKFRHNNINIENGSVSSDWMF